MRGAVAAFRAFPMTARMSSTMTASVAPAATTGVGDKGQGDESGEPNQQLKGPHGCASTLRQSTQSCQQATAGPSPLIVHAVVGVIIGGVLVTLCRRHPGPDRADPGVFQGHSPRGFSPRFPRPLRARRHSFANMVHG